MKYIEGDPTFVNDTHSCPDTLRKDFRSHWQAYTPVCFSPSPNSIKMTNKESSYNQRSEDFLGGKNRDIIKWTEQ